ncbi:hypothetical protein C6A85_12740, partial [Mycobacterium sp. ITM-2017-0098]
LLEGEAADLADHAGDEVVGRLGERVALRPRGAVLSRSLLGADLSYDFINRPAYHHALATADTEFLRLTLRTTLELGVDPAS